MDVSREAVDTAGPTVASLWAEVTDRDLGDQGLDWPPDVFAGVGTVLRRTHAYRFAVSPPPGREWPPHGSQHWNAAICGAAEQWAGWAEAPDGPPPALVTEAWQALLDGADDSLEDVADGRAWPVCEALLTLLALSDETCAGIAGAIDPIRTAGYRYRGRASDPVRASSSLARPR